MSSGLFDINPSIARHQFAGPEFFYSNLRIQETLTTLRYGIEARKGLTIVTGAPGLGKSTLLYKAAAELGPNTICVFESDPRVNFSDILRLILCHLDGDQPDEDESAMVRSCRHQLRARLDQCQIVALFLDNAHQFPEHTVRQVIETFLAKSGSDSEATLLQVILAGRTELRTKFSQGTLKSLNRRRPIICELQPLNSSEIAAFIEKGLKTSDRTAETFDERAIKRIALYANGNPGTVKFICERALQLAGGSTEARIPAELIESAAADLNVHLRNFDDSPRNPTAESRDFDTPKTSQKFENDDARDIPYKFSATEDVWTAPIYPPHAPEVHRGERHPRKRRSATGVRGLTFVILVGLVGFIALRHKDTASNIINDALATFRHYLETPYLPSTDEIELAGEIAPEKITNEPLVPLSGPDHPVELHEDAQPSSAGTSDSPAPSPPLFAGRQTRPEPNVASSANQIKRPAVKLNSGQQYENLQTQIIKAIENRAIMGIEVSVVQGTAYLDGHVATERQRRAAERAARSVAGVERVRNRIAITFG